MHQIGHFLEGHVHKPTDDEVIEEGIVRSDQMSKAKHFAVTWAIPLHPNQAIHNDKIRKDCLVQGQNILLKIVVNLSLLLPTDDSHPVLHGAGQTRLGMGLNLGHGDQKISVKDRICNFGQGARMKGYMGSFLAIQIHDVHAIARAKLVDPEATHGVDIPLVDPYIGAICDGQIPVASVDQPLNQRAKNTQINTVADKGDKIIVEVRLDENPCPEVLRKTI